MSDFLDPLDPQNRALLKRYLSSALGGDVAQFIGIPEAPKATRGGVENRNYELTAFVGDVSRRFVLRCPPAEIPEWRSLDGLYDLHREFRVLQELQNFPQLGAPKAYGYDAGETFGAPCFLMDTVDGAPLTEHLVPELNPKLLRQFTARLAEISRVAYQDNPWLNEHLPRWTNEWWFGWFERMVKPEAKDALYERALAWLKEKQPAKRALVFAHGDANPGNFLVRDDAISGVVDWEFAGLSDDPFSEIGFFVWLHDGQLAKPLAQELSDVLQRDIKETKWYFVRAWLGITFLGTDPASELFQLRREVLAQLTA